MIMATHNDRIMLEKPDIDHVDDATLSENGSRPEQDWTEEEEREIV